MVGIVAHRLRKFAYGFACIVVAAMAGAPALAQTSSFRDRVAVSTFDLAATPNSRIRVAHSTENQARSRERINQAAPRPVARRQAEQIIGPKLSLASTLNSKTDVTTIIGPQMTIRLRDQRGAEVVGNGVHFAAGSLSSDTAWNREFSVSLRPASMEDVGFELSAGTASLRRPEMFGSFQRRGVGEPDRWRELDSWQAGISLAPGAGNIKYSGGLAGTSYRRVQATQFQHVNSVLLGNPAWETGSASWHRIESNFKLSQNGTFEIFGMLGDRGEDFRDTALAIKHTPIFAGNTHELGIRWKGNDHETFAYHWAADGSEIDVRETSLDFRWNGMGVKWKEEYWGLNFALSDDLDERYLSDEFKWQMRGQIETAEAFGIAALPGFLPDRISVRYSKGRIKDTIGFAQVDAIRRENLSLDLTWDAANSSTEFGLDRWSRKGIEGPADLTVNADSQRGSSVMVSHSVWGDTWDASIYVSYDEETQPLGGNRSWSGGASWSLDRKDLPKLSLGIDYDSYDEDDILGRFRNRGIELSATLDFSRFLKSDGAGDRPSLLIRAYTEYEATRFEDLARRTRAGPTVLLTYAKNF